MSTMITSRHNAKEKNCLRRKDSVPLRLFGASLENKGKSLN